jgi:hypothetical protein
VTSCEAILLHPSFSAMWSTVSGHGVYSYLPKKASSLGQNLCDSVLCSTGFYQEIGYLVYGQSSGNPTIRRFEV